MDDKSFAADVLNKTIENLILKKDWTEEYNNIFKGLFEQGKFDNREEIYNAIVQGVKEK